MKKNKIRKDSTMLNRYHQRRSYRGDTCVPGLYELKRRGLNEQELYNLLLRQSGLL